MGVEGAEERFGRRAFAVNGQTETGRVAGLGLTDAGVPRGVGLGWSSGLSRSEYCTKDHHLALTPLPTVVHPAQALAHNPGYSPIPLLT